MIVASVAATHLYRRQTRLVEAAHAAAQIAAAQAASESFSNIRWGLTSVLSSALSFLSSLLRGR